MVLLLGCVVCWRGTARTGTSCLWCQDSSGEGGTCVCVCVCVHACVRACVYVMYICNVVVCTFLHTQ